MFAGSFKKNPLSHKLFQKESYNGILYDNNTDVRSDSLATILFQGVLYNRKKLGEEPLLSDAQLLLQLYRLDGIDAFKKLDGSFIAIIQTVDQTIIVRDHHGIGGQIYYTDSYFASSLSLLLECSQIKRQPNYRSLSSFLSIGYIPTDSTSFEGVSKVGAGQALVYSASGFKTFNLFDTSSITPSTLQGNPDTLSEQYGALHADAIRRRIGKSNNVGILLSGGYDSGCNLAALRKIYSGKIRSYSVGFKGNNWSELPLAKCMSETFDTIHSQYEITGSEIDSLPAIVRELGDPFVEGGLMVNYTAMRMIGTNKPDVILGGDGSDQYFGTTGREIALHYLAAKMGIKPLLQIAYTLLARDTFEKNTKAYRIRFHLNKVLNILQGNLFGFEPFQLSSILKNNEWIHKHASIKTDLRSFEHLYTQHAYRSDVDKIINQVILFKASRMADMFDNRLAFPYMDLELYNFLRQLPVSFKCKGDSPLQIAKGASTAKFLLKYHYRPMLPELITSKKKQGGFAPMPIFFSDRSRRERLGDFILSSSMLDDFLNQKNVEQFLKKYDREETIEGNWFWYKQNKAMQFFNLLNLAIWWETYVEGNDSVSL